MIGATFCEVPLTAFCATPGFALPPCLTATAPITFIITAAATPAVAVILAPSLFPVSPLPVMGTGALAVVELRRIADDSRHLAGVRSPRVDEVVRAAVVDTWRATVVAPRRRATVDARRAAGVPVLLRPTAVSTRRAPALRFAIEMLRSPSAVDARRATVVTPRRRATVDACGVARVPALCIAITAPSPTAAAEFVMKRRRPARARCAAVREARGVHAHGRTYTLLVHPRRRAHQRTRRATARSVSGAPARRGHAAGGGVHTCVEVGGWDMAYGRFPTGMVIYRVVADRP